MPGNPFHDEIFHRILMAQLEAILSCFITCYLADPHLATISFQAVIESDEVSSEPSFLQAEQPQHLSLVLLTNFV